MTLTGWQVFTIIAMMSVGTLATRFLPFILFPANKEVPPYMLYLGRILPYPVMGLLIVYCLRDVSITAKPYALPEAIAIIFIALLHLWRKNTMLSIAFGTVFYMLLVQFVFV